MSRRGFASGLEPAGAPDARIVTAAELLFAGEFHKAGRDGAPLDDDAPSGAFAFGVGMSGESGGPGDVAVAGGVQGVAAFGEGPAGAGVEFADGEEIGGDVLLGAGETFFGDGKLVHEGEAEVLFFGGEVDFEKAAAE